MSCFLRNFGMESLTETPENTQNLCRFIVQEGKPIIGYYGLPYINLHMGRLQFIARTMQGMKENHTEISGLDTHEGGSCVWNVRFHGIEMPRKGDDPLERRCLVQGLDGRGLAVVNIVNADVLPSFDEGVEAKLQMIAFPFHIEYHKDEKEYADAQPSPKDGEKMLLGDGVVLPIGFLKNHDPNAAEFEQDGDLDDLIQIRGTVKKLFYGSVTIGDKEFKPYLSCIIGTTFGDLEIVHTIDEVAEEQRDNMQIGAVVSGSFFLSGDAAIYEYENGRVLDEINDLSILRSTLAGADVERIRDVFAEDAVYHSERTGATYTGRDEIVERFKYVQQLPDNKYFPHMAVIISIDAGEETLPYEVGRGCIVLAHHEENNYESIAFIDLDEDGRIAKLVTSTNSRYHFHIDEKAKERTPLDDIEIPDSVIDPILLRARYHGIIDDTVTNEMVVASVEDSALYENNVRQLLASMPDGEEQTNLENLFGYLFAKAIETEYARKEQDKTCESGLLVSYAVGDAWNGMIQTQLDDERQEKTEAAMKLGKQFAKDFAFFHPFGEPHDDVYNDDLMKALLVVQQLGKLYEPKCLE